MSCYLDTGSGRADQTLGAWLDRNLTGGIRAFRCQFGYFRYAAIAPFAHVLLNAARAGFPVHFVLGSNGGSLIAQDAQRLIRLLDGEDATLTVIAFAAAEFHAKTVHILRADGSTVAAVGSSNLTENGLGVNAEASLVLDSAQGDDKGVIGSIAAAIDRWRNQKEDGVFRVDTDADIQALTDARIINVPQIAKVVAPAGSRARTGKNLGRRTRLWSPRSQKPDPEVAAAIEPPPVIARIAIPTSVATTVVAATRAVGVVRRWCKKLSNADAQQVSGSTNPKGMLTLTKARFPDVEFRTFFRNDLFGSLVWHPDASKGPTYEATHVPFNVRWHGTSLGQMSLLVDHDPARDYGQGNAYTWLHWGPLQKRLNAQPHVGQWVAISRDTSGAFSLTVQQHSPVWAP